VPQCYSRCSSTASFMPEVPAEGTPAGPTFAGNQVEVAPAGGGLPNSILPDDRSRLPGGGAQTQGQTGVGSRVAVRAAVVRAPFLPARTGVKMQLFGG